MLELVENVSSYQLQMLLEGGYLSDLLKADESKMNRNDFRKFCGLPPVVFPVWKTIKIGTPHLRTAEDFRKAIKDRKMRISDEANNIFGKSALAVATEETELDLVKATVAELSFRGGARHDQIYSRAKELGLEICPSEVGLQLRLQYQNQPKGEWILIAIEPITDSDGDPWVFQIKNQGLLLWVHSVLGYASCFWLPATRWVFVRPRK